MMNQEEELDELIRTGGSIKEPLVFCVGLPIHKVLRIKRAHDSLSLVALSNIIKVPKTTLSEIECGRRTIPRKHEKAIEDYIYHMWFSDGELIEMIEPLD